ncbi:LOW QUALITY PROTEIN: P2X purinoceptor 7-like [Pecten maximus]|uniref:LOW QUALITY PROTEIN: P2X purinoceptor 7-like n=1 Tax=Pecten maximus TaxID=6579 RepID=UPI0014582DA0|nr:LOW QUALITY PROTEIN: P2X purinoceptor 7-like [Pecten maximus]
MSNHYYKKQHLAVLNFAFTAILHFWTRIDEMSHEETKYILHQTAQQFPSLIFDLVKDSSGNSGGYHPRPDGNSPNWCLCGNCREMPTQPEKLCCKKDLPNCITLLPDFKVLILDEAVLALACLYRQDMFALPNEEDWKKANRHAPTDNIAYRQYILWQVGRLGTGDRRVIPSCAVWKIRDGFPDEFGQYTGFKAFRIA